MHFIHDTQMPNDKTLIVFTLYICLRVNDCIMLLSIIVVMKWCTPFESVSNFKNDKLLKPFISTRLKYITWFRKMKFQNIAFLIIQMFITCLMSDRKTDGWTDRQAWWQTEDIKKVQIEVSNHLALVIVQRLVIEREISLLQAQGQLDPTAYVSQQ